MDRLTRLDWGVALFAIVAIFVHDVAHVVAGRYWDVFWICNVAALCVGPAILLRSPALSAVAFTWLVPGTVVWLVDALVAGSHILPTSYAVHLGGTGAAVYATRRFGVAKWGWLLALAVLAGAVIFSRVALPPAANVNAAHAVPRGWGFLGGSRSGFAALAVGIALATCVVGRVLGRALAIGATKEKTAHSPFSREW